MCLLEDKIAMESGFTLKSTVSLLRVLEQVLTINPWLLKSTLSRAISTLKLMLNEHSVFISKVYIVFKPFYEVDIISSSTHEEIEARNGDVSSVISETLLGSSRKSWLSIFPFEYLGRQWGKETPRCFSFSLGKHFIYFAFPCLFWINKQKKFLLHSWFYPCWGPGQDLSPAEPR